MSRAAVLLAATDAAHAALLRCVECAPSLSFYASVLVLPIFLNLFFLATSVVDGFSNLIFSFLLHCFSRFILLHTRTHSLTHTHTHSLSLSQEGKGSSLNNIEPFMVPNQLYVLKQSSATGTEGQQEPEMLENNALYESAQPSVRGVHGRHAGNSNAPARRTQQPRYETVDLPSDANMMQPNQLGGDDDVAMSRNELYESSFGAPNAQSVV